MIDGSNGAETSDPGGKRLEVAFGQLNSRTIQRFVLEPQEKDRRWTELEFCKT